MDNNRARELILVQIGNSRTQLAKYADRMMSDPVAFETRSLLRGNREVQPALRRFFASNDSSQIRIVSVVSEATEKLRTRLEHLSPTHRIKVITHRDVPMRSEYRPHRGLGLDRLVASFGAWKRFAEPKRLGLLLVDLGTATTYNCVSSEGVFLGGAITLGIESTMLALSERTSLLPEVALSFPPTVLGKTTIDAMRSGVMFGSVAGIQGMIGQLRAEAFGDTSPVVVLTGGLSPLLEPHLTGISELAPRILLEGLAML